MLHILAKSRHTDKTVVVAIGHRWELMYKQDHESDWPLARNSTPAQNITSVTFDNESLIDQQSPKDKGYCRGWQ